MKVLFEFGYPGIKREVNWWRPFEDIPHIMRFQNVVWSAVAYNKGVLGVDWHYIFAKHHDQNTWSAPLFEVIFNVPVVECQCGAVYTSSADHHMFFCPKWSRQ